MNNNNKQLSVKMKVVGIEYQIDCEQNQIADVVSKILNATITRYNQLEPFNKSSNLPKRRRDGTCKNVITLMLKDGFLDEPRDFGCIYEEMERRAYHYDKTSLAHALRQLTEKKLLIRKGIPRKYNHMKNIEDETS